MILSVHQKSQYLMEQQSKKVLKSDILAVYCYLSIDKHIFLAFIRKPVLKQSLPVDLFVLSAM